MLVLCNPLTGIYMQATPKDKSAALLIRGRVDEVCWFFFFCNWLFDCTLVEYNCKPACQSIHSKFAEWQIVEANQFFQWILVLNKSGFIWSRYKVGHKLFFSRIIRGVLYTGDNVQVILGVMDRLHRKIPPYVRIDRILLSYYYYWTSKIESPFYFVKLRFPVKPST